MCWCDLVGVVNWSSMVDGDCWSASTVTCDTTDTTIRYSICTASKTWRLSAYVKVLRQHHVLCHLNDSTQTSKNATFLFPRVGDCWSASTVNCDTTDTMIWYSICTASKTWRLSAYVKVLGQHHVLCHLNDSTQTSKNVTFLFPRVMQQFLLAVSRMQQMIRANLTEN